MVKFSVIVPIYNVEKYIRKCLETIEAQTFRDFEVICVDDCGSDNSMKIAEEFAQRNPNFKIVKHEENRGLSAARNTGIKLAQGEFLVFIDSDDYIDTSLLQKVSDAFDTHDVDSVWYNAKICFERTGEQILMLRDRLPFSGEINLNSENITRFSDYAWNKVFRASKLKELNMEFAEGLFFEDSEFYFRVFTQIKKVYYIKDPLYYYQSRENSIVTSSEKDELKFYHLFLIIENLYAYYKENNLFDEYKRVLLKIFSDRVISVKVKKKRDFIIPIAARTLETIDFPNSYTDLKIDLDLEK
jgi:glycosyltransferase involved in cell wall biosynthesis